LNQYAKENKCGKHERFNCVECTKEYLEEEEITVDNIWQMEIIERIKDVKMRKELTDLYEKMRNYKVDWEKFR